MSLPHLLLVDDSEVVLAFARAALSGHYLISTASNGREAQAKIPQQKPDGIVLDLSMPEMDGDEVLAWMQRDPQLRQIPVIIVSSEKVRAEACLRAGARAYLPKPVKGPELLATTSRVLEEAARERKSGGLAVLFVSVGAIEIGIPLESVRGVLHQTATQPLPLGPAYLNEVVDVHGQPVFVLDLARRFGVEHEKRIEDRMLIVVEASAQRFALCVDSVRDPEEVPASDLTRREQLGGSEHGPLQQALLAMVRSSRGPIAVVDPAALASRSLLRSLADTLRAGNAA